MKLTNIPIVALLPCALFTNAFSADCQIKSNALDLRDNGLEFQQQDNVFFRSINGLPTGCKTTLRATGLVAPRSNILSEIKDPDSLLMFQESLEITDVALQTSASGGMEFYRLHIGRYGYTDQELAISIVPDSSIPQKGEPARYILSGVVHTLDASGSSVSPVSFFYQTLSTLDSPKVVWRKYEVGAYGDRYELDMNFGNNSVRLMTFDPTLPPQGQSRFVPTWRRYGNLGEYNLSLSSSFKLKPSTVCQRWAGNVNGPNCF
jgi:hypothetical protein